MDSSFKIGDRVQFFPYDPRKRACITHNRPLTGIVARMVTGGHLLIQMDGYPLASCVVLRSNPSLRGAARRGRVPEGDFDAKGHRHFNAGLPLMP